MSLSPGNRSDVLKLVTFSEGWRLGVFPSLTAIHGIAHAVTTRQGPAFVSAADAPATAAAVNELSAALRLRGLAWAEQVHGDQVLCVAADGLAGQADGLITDTAGLGVLGRSADCPLVLLVGRKGDGGNEAGSSSVVGMAHASWRSTLKGITSRVVTLIQQTWQVDPTGITAAICPSAGPCCYEVGEEVRETALTALGSEADRFFPARQGKLYFDLWAANEAQLRATGIPAHHIHTAGICTLCRNDLFPSYRREGEAAARFAAVIGIEPRFFA
jgi:YfiH family protein